MPPDVATDRVDDRLVLALAQIEEAEESLRAARALIRELFKTDGARNADVAAAN